MPPDPDGVQNVPIEQLETERSGLRRAAIHLCSMILADASGSRGGGALSQDGAQFDLEKAAILFVRRLDALSNGGDSPRSSEGSDQN